MKRIEVPGYIGTISQSRLKEGLNVVGLVDAPDSPLGQEDNARAYFVLASRLGLTTVSLGNNLRPYHLAADPLRSLGRQRFARAVETGEPLGFKPTGHKYFVRDSEIFVTYGHMIGEIARDSGLQLKVVPENKDDPEQRALSLFTMSCELILRNHAERPFGENDSRIRFNSEMLQDNWDAVESAGDRLSTLIGTDRIPADINQLPFADMVKLLHQAARYQKIQEQLTLLRDFSAGTSQRLALAGIDESDVPNFLTAANELGIGTAVFRPMNAHIRLPLIPQRHDIRFNPPYEARSEFSLAA